VQLPAQEMAPSPASTPLPLGQTLDSHAQGDSGVHENAQDPEISKRAMAYRERNTGFNLKNLPPRQVISRCLVSFFRGYGVFYFFLPDVHTMSLYRAAYSLEQDELSTIDAIPNMSNAEFSLLLLTAAVGALYAEDSDVPVKHIRQKLFAVGKYHLDVAVGNIQDGDIVGDGGGGGTNDETDILTITALATAALYMIFEKEIRARKYIGTSNFDVFLLTIYTLPYSSYYTHIFIHFIAFIIISPSWACWDVGAYQANQGDRRFRLLVCTLFPARGRGINKT